MTVREYRHTAFFIFRAIKRVILFAVGFILSIFKIKQK